MINRLLFFSLVLYLILIKFECSEIEKEVEEIENEFVIPGFADSFEENENIINALFYYNLNQNKLKCKNDLNDKRAFIYQIRCSLVDSLFQSICVYRLGVNVMKGQLTIIEKRRQPMLKDEIININNLAKLSIIEISLHEKITNFEQYIEEDKKQIVELIMESKNDPIEDDLEKNLIGFNFTDFLSLFF